MTADRESRPALSLETLRELWQNTARMFALIWHDQRRLVVSMLVIIALSSLSVFFVSASQGFLVNELVRALKGGQALVALALFLFIAAMLLSPLLQIIELYLSKLFWFFLERKLNIMVIRKKAEIDIAVHEDPSYNDLLNRVREQGIFRTHNFVDREFFLFQNIIEVAAASAILLAAKWWIFLLLLFATIPELVAEVKYGKFVWNIHMASAEVRRRYWDLQRRFDMPSLTELRVFQNARHLLGLIARLFRSFQEKERKVDFQRMVAGLVSLTLSQGAVAISVVWFVMEVMHQRLQIGTFVFFLSSMGRLQQSLSAFFMNLGRQYEDSFFVSDIVRLLRIQPVIVPRRRPLVRLSPRRTPKIVFDKVSFRYPGSKQYAVRDFSLRIAPGAKIAIVGLNGSGKTTLVKLLCRFYDPSEGAIFLDGQDLRDIDLATWYRQLGVLFQEYEKYYFPVGEAIALGNTAAPFSMAKVRRAARASGADSFIRKWGKRYEQMLGKQFYEGVEPSLGQWQKLALARTFYRNPRVFVLDEPTSSLDPSAEAKIFAQLERLPKEKTVILVSHRFSTVRHAHTICVLEDGKLAEYGTHRELMRREGMYARLFRIQSQGYR